MSNDDELWRANYPELKMPGSNDSQPGKCGARLRSKELKILGITRYCTKTSGMGTNHFGEGRCKLHGGSTPNHAKTAVRKVMEKELATISANLGEPAPMGPPEVEAFQLASKAKQWVEIIEVEMGKLGELVVTDDAGIEHARAVIEIWERGIDRFQKFIEFMMKHDLQRRVVELEEKQAQIIAEAYMRIVLSQELKLTEKQVKLARSMFADAMRELGPALVPTWSAGLYDESHVVEAELL